MAASPIVLVHGAWHGGWCWREVARALRAAGHPVYTPTLTGMGERAHLGTPATDVAAHAADIAGVIEAEELEGVVLVGHSYGGVPALVAADRLGARVRRLVLLDAIVPVAGEPALGPPTPEQRAWLAAHVIDGWRVPPLPPAAFDVTGPEAAWVTRRLTTMPLAALTGPVPPFGAARAPATYVRCARSTLKELGDDLARARARGWPVVDLDAGHDAMVTAPGPTARLLGRLAAA